MPELERPCARGERARRIGVEIAGGGGDFDDPGDRIDQRDFDDLQIKVRDDRFGAALHPGADVAEAVQRGADLGRHRGERGALGQRRLRLVADGDVLGADHDRRPAAKQQRVRRDFDVDDLARLEAVSPVA